MRVPGGVVADSPGDLQVRFVDMRDLICNDLGNLGIKLDLVKNKVRGKEAIISRDDSRVSIMLIPTNEELMIARDTYDITKNL